MPSRVVVAHPSALKKQVAVEKKVVAPAKLGPRLRGGDTPRRGDKEIFSRIFAMALGIGLFIVAWAFIAKFGRIPDPAAVFKEAVVIFSDPFYRKGPNDQGIGWNVLTSLGRVGMGFGLAAMVGIPLGFVIGRFRFLGDMAAPIIALLKPVSPLAWLPIGLLMLKAANPASIFAIFVCSIWPLVMNTAAGVRQVPQDYLNVARVLNLSEWKIFTRILFPAVLPYMLTGGVGIGFWVWDEWNNLKVDHIIIAIFVIGMVGLALEQSLIYVARKVSHGVGG